MTNAAKAVENPGKLTVFDCQHPPVAELLNACVHCGFCLPTCPTYVLWGKEMDSPRGRIQLMNQAAAGETGMSDTFVAHFDRCLGCQACVTVCPSGVEFGKLIEAMRGQVERNYRRGLGERLLRWMLQEIFPHPSRLRLLAVPLRLYQRLGVQWLVHALGLTRLLPSGLRAMERLIPCAEQETATLPERISAKGARRRTVALLTGCVQSVFFSQVNAATARVLAAEGCEVVVPAGQGCCGALLMDLGEEEKALAMARALIDCVDRYRVDNVIVNAAGCGATVKEYGYLLRDDPAYRERAAAFSAKCREVSQLLAELGPRAKRNRVALRVGVHDPCHLQHAQGVREQPRAALRTIPGVEIVELPDGAICCGSAGIYNMVQPETARELGRRKVEQILSTSAQVVVTGNPGCELQLKSLLNEMGATLPVMHYVELLDASLQGVKPRGVS